MDFLDEDDQYVAALALTTIILEEEEKEARRAARGARRRLWSRKWLQRREEGGQYKTLVQELALEDQGSYRNWMRVNRSPFHKILDMIQPSISKTDTRMINSERHTSLSYQFRVSLNLISLINPETCSAIYEALQPIYMRMPRSQEEWRKVSEDFHSLWNYPLCLGALDGKRSNEKHIHNYRLSRARRVSENAFGILSSRFQVFNKPIRTCPERANKVIQACLVLHNMLRTESRQAYSPPELLDQEDIQRRRMVVGQWHDHQHNALGDMQVIARRPKRDAMQVRDLFCMYFNNEGSVPWQNEMALLH
ncbi:hypothetical protein Pmani_010217 [Petrolisthes manimaculis]|uniref:DDE Tnp4 domain-containing protein n=1 Tax=Petrolisthes manimaculis TaxID=1843537 RepID=A0AAE1Q3J4_9EUCA|nr:hypothetical protein Pmani_010217 [Petrolisthes manimaculis]